MKYWMVALGAFCAIAQAQTTQPQFSGRYPHLAMFNDQGECGTGAVVPWAGKLWVITYAPHKPAGSDDKLYEISPDLTRVIRPESVGGTPADRLIHRESNQLIIGPYVIDAEGKVRAVSPKLMPGRLTAAARHLVDPANKVYVYDMEGALFELNVHTLAVKKLFDRVTVGAHGKGMYSGQGRLFFANNGDQVVNKAAPFIPDVQQPPAAEPAGALASWDGGKGAGTLILRRQFTDITGPGGIAGNGSADDPVWALGWDNRSVLLELFDKTRQEFRLPIADGSYVARHGWYTEWPRIRDVGNGKLLMNMHGQWFDFPQSFANGHAGGIRAIGDYLKITGDFCGWQNKIVFGCDDASLLENPLLGQSQSNLWFTSWDKLRECGAPAGFGGPWLHDDIGADPSAPYLFAGYTQRVLHLAHDSDQPVTFTIEIDPDGTGRWARYRDITVPPHGYAWHVFPEDVTGEWVRLKADHAASKATAYFRYNTGGGAVAHPEKFAALADPSDKMICTGKLRPLGGDRGTLWFDANAMLGPSTPVRLGSREVAADLTMHRYRDVLPPSTSPAGAAAPYAVTRDGASIILTQNKQRYRLPTFDAGCDEPQASGLPRPIREVVTERFLVNAGGSFFVLPRPTAGGALRLKPISSHGKRIGDLCSWRGLLVMSGTKETKEPSLWFGDVDDLWQLGHPRGHGGPWLQTPVNAGEPSDPYLMAGYDRKTLTLSHDASRSVSIKIEVDVAADGTFQVFDEIKVGPNAPVRYEFPRGYGAHWVRFTADTACRATATLDYE